MAEDNQAHPTTTSRCYKCKGPTRFYSCVLDPQSSKSYSLFECDTCKVITSHVETAKK